MFLKEAGEKPLLSGIAIIEWQEDKIDFFTDDIETSLICLMKLFSLTPKPAA